MRRLDRNDSDLLASALTEDVAVDSTPLATKLGMQASIMTSRDVVVRGLVERIGPLDTSHSVSNPRVTVKGDSATLEAYVMAQHFRRGEGSRPSPDRTHVLYMHRYAAELIRQGLFWRMSRIVIDNVWVEGDAGAVFEPRPKE